MRIKVPSPKQPNLHYLEDMTFLETRTCCPLSSTCECICDFARRSEDACRCNTVTQNNLPVPEHAFTPLIVSVSCRLDGRSAAQRQKRPPVKLPHIGSERSNSFPDVLRMVRKTCGIVRVRVTCDM